MKIEFDPEKNARNMLLRGISFEEAVRFEWESAVIIPDAAEIMVSHVTGLSASLTIVFLPWFLAHGRGQSGLSAFARPIVERCFDMKPKSNPELIDKENPEWTEEDFQHARPAAELLPELFGPKVAAGMLKSRGRPKAAETKTHFNIRLDNDVLEAFKATGRGW